MIRLWLRGARKQSPWLFLLVCLQPMSGAAQLIRTVTSDVEDLSTSDFWEACAAFRLCRRTRAIGRECRNALGSVSLLNMRLVDPSPHEFRWLRVLPLSALRLYDHLQKGIARHLGLRTRSSEPTCTHSDISAPSGFARKALAVPQ